MEGRQMFVRCSQIAFRVAIASVLLAFPALVAGNAQPMSRLTVSKTGSGAGTVTSDPPGIICGLACSVNFVDGTVVNLFVNPSSSSVFGCWDPLPDPDCLDGVVTMDADKTCTAVFRSTVLDADFDGVANAFDNCIYAANGPLLGSCSAQEDGNSNGYGNACDMDFNNDLLHTGADVAPFITAIGNSDPGADINCDGLLTGADVAPGISVLGASPAPGPSALYCP